MRKEGEKEQKTGQKKPTIQEWLKNLNLTKYEEKLKEFGLTSLSEVSALPSEDVKDIAGEVGMTTAERIKFGVAVKKIEK
eukprot:UN03162